MLLTLLSNQTTGAVTLFPPLTVNTNVFYAPTVTSGANQSLAPDLYVNTNAFYDGAVSTTYTLAPEVISNANAFYTHTITRGTITLTPDRYDNPSTFYGPIVSQGSVILLPTLLVNINAFYNPTISTGAVNLTPALYDNTNTFYNPTVSSSAINLAPEIYTNTNVFFSASVSGKSTSGSLVKKRRKFRPSIPLNFEKQEVVQPPINARTTLAGLSVTVTVGSLIAKSPDPIDSRAVVRFTRIESYIPKLVARSSWNDPSDEELVFILDFVLG
jgi:hypothetical protein